MQSDIFKLLLFPFLAITLFAPNKDSFSVLSSPVTKGMDSGAGAGSSRPAGTDGSVRSQPRARDSNTQISEMWLWGVLIFYFLGFRTFGREGGMERHLLNKHCKDYLILFKKKIQEFTMLLCCQIVCWIQVWLLMCKCLNNVLFMMKGTFFYIKYLFYK